MVGLNNKAILFTVPVWYQVSPLQTFNYHLIHKFYTFLCCLVLTYSNAPCQKIGSGLAFNPITINDGLSQGMIIRIFQDRYGFMWFATLDGLNRYDGNRFVIYRHDALNASSITESYVQSFFEDSKGRLWVGTVSGGLDLFDRAKEVFIHVRQKGVATDPLANNPINSITEDARGNIWVDVSGKLYKVAAGKTGGSGEEPFNISQVKLPFVAESSHLYGTNSGKIYYVNSTRGILYKLENEKAERWSVMLQVDDCFDAHQRTGKPHYRITNLLEDKLRGKLYVFYEGGIIRYNERSGKQEKTYDTELFLKHNAPLQASIDREGIIWLVLMNKLFLFDTRSGKVTQAEAKDPDHSQLLQHTTAAFVDRSGLLWLGTNGYGLLKRNSRSENFHHTGTTSEYSIKENSDGKILIGNNAVVKFVFDRTKEELVDVTKAAFVKSPTRVLNSSMNSPIATDQKGSWFADNNTLRYYDKKLNKCTRYTLPVSVQNEYSELIQCKIKDSAANIWLGTTAGLMRFNMAEKTWTVYQNKSDDTNSVSSNLIFTLCLDPVQPTKYLWIGTADNGLNKMDLTTGKFRAYSTTDGLPNNVIYGILNGDDGNLWISTNKGLSCFNLQNQTFRNFSHKDGLQSNEFNRGAYCRTKDGALFFGGVNGFNYFYPQQITRNRIIPQIVITGLQVRNNPVPIQPEGSPLKDAIYLTKEITLTYDQNFVAFEFSSMDFTNPEKNQYQYKLVGLDDNWINSGSTHTATYTNLNPGTYTFWVRGSNNDDTWNEKGTFINLIILPPWYMTWWFRLAIVVAVSMAGYALYRYRRAQELKLQGIRDKIAQDLHDEVGSNLSNISIFSNVVQQKTLANDETSRLMLKISEYTQQSMEAMNDIVWMINTRNDRFENIMVRMRMLAAEVTETSDCSLHLDFDEKLNDVKLNMEVRKNFYLIYKEAINNTAKYAGCKGLWIEMKLKQSTLTLKIIDDGKGFDMVNAINGNGLYNMKKRAEMLNGALTFKSTVGEGTTLQLSFKV